MHKEEGIVTEIKGQQILVESIPSDMCNTCAIQGSCLSGIEERKRKIWIVNSKNARPGDTVEFGIEEGTVIASSLVLYLIPVVMLLGGALVGYQTDYFGIDADLKSALGGFIGLIISFGIIKVISSFAVRKKGFNPVLLRIVKRLDL